MTTKILLGIAIIVLIIFLIIRQIRRFKVKKLAQYPPGTGEIVTLYSCRAYIAVDYPEGYKFLREVKRWKEITRNKEVGFSYERFYKTFEVWK